MSNLLIGQIFKKTKRYRMSSSPSVRKQVEEWFHKTRPVFSKISNDEEADNYYLSLEKYVLMVIAVWSYFPEIEHEQPCICCISLRMCKTGLEHIVSKTNYEELLGKNVSRACISSSFKIHGEIGTILLGKNSPLEDFFKDIEKCLRGESAGELALTDSTSSSSPEGTSFPQRRKKFTLTKSDIIINKTDLNSIDNPNLKQLMRFDNVSLGRSFQFYLPCGFKEKHFEFVQTIVMTIVKNMSEAVNRFQLFEKMSLKKKKRKLGTINKGYTSEREKLILLGPDFGGHPITKEEKQRKLEDARALEA